MIIRKNREQGKEKLFDKWWLISVALFWYDYFGLIGSPNSQIISRMLVYTIFCIEVTVVITPSPGPFSYSGHSFLYCATLSHCLKPTGNQIIKPMGSVQEVQVPRGKKRLENFWSVCVITGRKTLRVMLSI